MYLYLPPLPLRISLSTFFGPLNRIEREREREREKYVEATENTGHDEAAPAAKYVRLLCSPFLSFSQSVSFFGAINKQKMFRLLSAARCSHVTRLEYW